jgi:competence protein ComEC
MESPEDMLTVAFLDVGQGDAIFIESPSGTQVLIDGGTGGDILASLGRVTGFFDRDLDMILATHPDADHIGGLVDVLEHYTVHVIVMTENESDSPVFAAFLKAVEAEGASVIFARKGQVYDLGEGMAGDTTLSVLFPDHDPRELQSNDASIVARLAYGESSYLLTGDSPSAIEAYLTAEDAAALQSDILKVGHHGSRTSTSDIFLDAVHPILGVISAGKDNEYGHPHAEVLARLTAHGVAYKNTAEEGSIVSVSDGKEIWLR